MHPRNVAETDGVGTDVQHDGYEDEERGGAVGERDLLPGSGGGGGVSFGGVD